MNSIDILFLPRVKIRYLIITVLSIGFINLSEGTIHLDEANKNFQLHRRLFSGEIYETTYRIALNDSQVVEIKDGNTSDLEQKLDALDMSRERIRYDYALNNIQFEGTRLIIDAVHREYAIFQPTEITEDSKLKLRVLDPRITSQVIY